MKLNVMVVLSVLIAQVAFAGDKIGNGGGLWACENSLQQIQSAEMVDLFEAQTEFGLSVPPQASMLAQQIAIQKTQILERTNQAITDKLSKYLNEVFHKTQFVNAVLERVDDALFRIEPLPSTCAQGKWQYVQFANFTAQDQVLIRNDVWTSSAVSELDKGALLVHEAVYRWMRVEFSDSTSVRSRQIVGLLFSSLSAQEINLRIQTLLGPSSSPGILDSWACLITNPNARRFFLGFGQSQAEAQINSSQACAKETTSFFCGKESAQCEQAQSNAMTWYCALTNPNSHQNFSGKGRTKIEASYRALKSCEDASDGGFFCSNPACSSNP
jgi:hypothetical protein